MDNCVGTNKSQFCFGGLAILVLLGILDSIEFAYMVVGHTKFNPDVICRHIAGQYQISDCFNLAMLLGCIVPYANGLAYNDHILRTWKETSRLIFTDVPRITSYRYFMLIGADEDFNKDLGSGVVKGAVCAPETKDFPSSGSCFSTVSLNGARDKLAARSLMKVIEQVQNGTFAGIGSGHPQYGGKTALFELELPAVVTALSPTRETVNLKYNNALEDSLGVSLSLITLEDKSKPIEVGSKVLVRRELPQDTVVRHVRLFARMNESDEHWIEFPDYHNKSMRNIEAVNTALLRSVPYNCSEIAGRFNASAGAAKFVLDQVQFLGGYVYNYFY